MAEIMRQPDKDFFIPSREGSVRETTKKSFTSFPSSQFPETENGTGKFLFNKGNPDDPSFDGDNTFCRICHILITGGGHAHVNTLITEGNLTFQDVTKAITPGVIFSRVTEGGTELVAPHLIDLLEEFNAKGVEHVLLNTKEAPTLAAD